MAAEAAAPRGAWGPRTPPGAGACHSNINNNATNSNTNNNDTNTTVIIRRMIHKSFDLTLPRIFSLSLSGNIFTLFVNHGHSVYTTPTHTYLHARCLQQHHSALPLSLPHLRYHLLLRALEAIESALRRRPCPREEEEISKRYERRKTSSVSI